MGNNTHWDHYNIKRQDHGLDPSFVLNSIVTLEIMTETQHGQTRTYLWCWVLPREGYCSSGTEHCDTTQEKCPRHTFLPSRQKEVGRQLTLIKPQLHGKHCMMFFIHHPRMSPLSLRSLLWLMYFPYFFQMRNLELREVKYLAQGHTVGETRIGS